MDGNCNSSVLSNNNPELTSCADFQLDGNMSFTSSCSKDVFLPCQESSEETFNIGTIVGNRPPGRPDISQHRMPCRKTLRRDNRGELALYLPNLAVYNHRSIWKKINNFGLEFSELDMGIAFNSEIWEKKESKRHKYRIDEMFEMKSISYLSTPRPNRRVGGGWLSYNL